MTTKLPTATEINWHFNWSSGGYNSVLAIDRAQALEKAEALGKGWLSGHVINLEPDENFVITRTSDIAFGARGWD